MEDNKFLSALRTLDMQELDAFRKYLEGNYGRQKIALAVFKYLKPFYPGFRDEKKLDIAYAYRKIFNADIHEYAYNRTKLLNALSDLNLWLNEFWVWNKARDGSLESQALWLMITKERGLKNEYNKQYKLIREQLAASEKTSVTDLLTGLLANYFFYYSPLEKKSGPDIPALAQCASDLDNYFAVARLKIACEMANLNLRLNPDFQQDGQAVVQDLLNWPHVAEHPLYQIYKEMYALTVEGNDDAFASIDAWVNNNHKKIGKEDLHIALSYIHNYAALQLRSGRLEYVPIIHRLNVFALEHGFFQRVGGISPTQFCNIVNVACNQHDFEWADHFIATCNMFLDQAQRADTVILSKAIALFEKKQYEETLNSLFGVDFSDIEFAIRAKSLVLRCYFELRRSNSQFESYYQAFETFLYRKQITRPLVVKSTLNFIHLLKSMYDRNITRDKLMRKINSAKDLYLREWLLEKARQYKD